MSVYSRYKRLPEGFRSLVELLETTPLDRRQKMIEIGRAEDPEYTEKALSYMLTFEDIIHLPELELAELIATAPIRMTALAISKSGEETQSRFLKNALPKIAGELRDQLKIEAGLREVGGAQLKLVEVTRQLEKKGFIKTKRIPFSSS